MGAGYINRETRDPRWLISCNRGGEGRGREEGMLQASGTQTHRRRLGYGISVHRAIP